MRDDISNNIINLMQSDMRRDYTIPDLMTSLQIVNREKIVAALARLEGENKVEISREKGRTKYYRLKVDS